MGARVRCMLRACLLLIACMAVTPARGQLVVYGWQETGWYYWVTRAEVGEGGERTLEACEGSVPIRLPEGFLDDVRHAAGTMAEGDEIRGAKPELRVILFAVLDECGRVTEACGTDQSAYALSPRESFVLVQAVRSAFLEWQFACLHREDQLAGAPLFATFTYPLISEE